ncbi:MAG: SUMF1/EgtB/PvdO family nonheme iron enzyme [Phycisphaerales bacterium]|nr:MAG: SUMF1/EgtB/PvdO family nonheme iron enzyme [Phycisphaerales bacterium]
MSLTTLIIHPIFYLSMPAGRPVTTRLHFVVVFILSSVLCIRTTLAEQMHADSQPMPVVAVCPCILGPEVTASVGSVITEVVVETLSKIPNLEVMDRSLTKNLLSEQDLVIATQASDTLAPTFGKLGAQQMLVITVSKVRPYLLVGLRLVDIATGRIIRSTIYQETREARLPVMLGEWVKAFWDGGAPQKLSLSPAIEAMWQELDETTARQLLGSELDRAESVYRQYVRAANSGDVDRALQLEHHAGIYLMDCIALLRRAMKPPEGMVYVPPGRVEITFPGVERRHYLVFGFFIDRVPFTRARYKQFMESTGRKPPLGWSTPTETTTNLPVVHINWHEAVAVAAWRGMRLPTYPQWLRASSGDGARKYPWGDMWRPDCCNYAVNPNQPMLEPVGSYPQCASPYGVLDCVGGVLEWLDTSHDPAYWKTAPKLNPRGPQQGVAKLAVGGSYRGGAQHCTCRFYEPLTALSRKDNLGFRCVLPLKQ